MAEFSVEVVFALAEKQSLQTVVVVPGTTVAELIEKSGLLRLFPECGIDELAVGIWGSEVERGRLVREGDRIEIYRPLKLDPREATLGSPRGPPLHRRNCATGCAGWEAGGQCQETCERP